MLVSTTGAVLRSEIMGVVRVKCHLSGMPELRLGLNEKFTLGADHDLAGSPPAAPTGAMEDVKFHQCVRLQKFDQDRTISFIPPDGDFDLLSYRVGAADLKPPIWAECVIERWSSSRVEYLIKVSGRTPSHPLRPPTQAFHGRCARS